MASSSQHLLTIFLVFFISSSTITSATTVYDVLEDNGLPRGLLPDNVKNYSLSDEGEFVVTLASECYVKFDDLVYYDTTIKGTLTFGSIKGLSGIKAKKLFVWVSVSSIELDYANQQIEFHVGAFVQNIPIERFANVATCRSKVNLAESMMASLPMRGAGMGYFPLTTITQE